MSRLSSPRAFLFLIILGHGLVNSWTARPSIKAAQMVRNEANILNISDEAITFSEESAMPHEDPATLRHLESPTELEKNTVQIGTTIFLSAMSMALSGNGRFMAIGGIDGDPSQEGYHVVRVLENRNGSWEQVGSDLMTEDNDNTSFGSAVSISCDGSTIAVGSKRQEPAGQMQVYRWDGMKWNQVGGNNVVFFPLPKHLHPPSNKVSLSGDGTVVVLGWFNFLYDRPGQVRIYKWNGDWWQEMGNIDHWEDESVSVIALSEDGSVIAFSINAINYGGPDSNGYIIVFQWDGDGWIELGNRILGISNEVNFRSLDLSSRGNILVAGGNGYVRIFELQNGDWQQLGQRIEGESPDDDLFGNSVSISGDGSVVSIGAPQAAKDGLRVGYVRLFQFDGTRWQQIIEFDGEPYYNRLIGSATSISKDGATVAFDGREGGERFVKVYFLEPLSSSAYVCIPSVTLSPTISPVPTTSPVTRTRDDIPVWKMVLVACGLFVGILAVCVFMAMKHAQSLPSQALSSTRQTTVERRADPTRINPLADA